MRSNISRDWVFISGLIVAVIATAAACSHVTPSTYLIPQNFRGKFTIFYDEPCGVRIPESGGRLIYHIPANGVMIVSNHLETGVTDDLFFFVDTLGNEMSEIPQKFKSDFGQTRPGDHSRTVVSAIMDGVFSQERRGMNSATGIKSQGTEWYILSWDSIEAYTSHGIHALEAQHEKLADSLLDYCRAKK